MFLLAGSLALLSTGCVTWWGPEDLRRSIALRQNVGLKREFGVGMDGLAAGLVGLLAGKPLPFGSVSSIEVGVYTVKNEDKLRLNDLDFSGWEPIVRVRTKEDETLLLVKIGRDNLHGLMVLTRDQEELVIVRLKGRIDKLLDWALKDSAGGNGHASLPFEFVSQHGDKPPKSRNPMQWLNIAPAANATASEP